MDAKHKKALVVGAIAVVVFYQAFKMLTKPKTPEMKSNASGKKLVAGTLNYNPQTGKVSKLVIDGFDSRWVQLSESQQPKAMEWYRFNGKNVWVKWNGKFQAPWK